MHFATLTAPSLFPYLDLGLVKCVIWRGREKRCINESLDEAVEIISRGPTGRVPEHGADIREHKLTAGRGVFPLPHLLR